VLIYPWVVLGRMLTRALGVFRSSDTGKRVNERIGVATEPLKRDTAVAKAHVESVARQSKVSWRTRRVARQLEQQLEAGAISEQEFSARTAAVHAKAEADAHAIDGWLSEQVAAAGRGVPADPPNEVHSAQANPTGLSLGQQIRRERAERRRQEDAALGGAEQEGPAVQIQTCKGCEHVRVEHVDGNPSGWVSGGDATERWRQLTCCVGSRPQRLLAEPVSNVMVWPHGCSDYREIRSS
jgi:hypothetical protein